MPHKRQKREHSTPEAWTTRKQPPGRPSSADVTTLLTRLTGRSAVSQFRENQVVFAQRDPADSVSAEDIEP